MQSLWRSRFSRFASVLVVAYGAVGGVLADPPPRSPEDAVTPVDRSPARHAQFLARIQEGPVGLLFLGDSILDWWPRTGPDTWAKFSPDQPANFGVAGERTEDLLWRIQNGELDGIHPRAVVLLIGTNNAGVDQPAWTVAGIRKIVDTIHDKLPETRVLLLALLPRDAAGSPHRRHNEAVNQAIRKLDDGEKTRYLDVGKVFLDAQGNILPDTMPDKLHPSARGYQLWYDAMEPALAPLLR